MKYVIAGGSIAAHTAYTTIKRFDDTAEVIVLSKENTMPYGKMLLPYLISSDSVESNMFYTIEKDDILLNNEVKKLDNKEKTITTETGLKISYDKLLIATGADAYIPEYKGNYSDETVLGIRYLSDMDKAKKRMSVCNNKHAILIGAGLVTLETGWALVKKGFSVTYVVRSGRILSQILDKESADMVEGYIEKNYPVKFIKNTDIESINERENRVYVELTTKQTIEGCMVVVGKGVRPNTEFLKDSDIKADGGIEINGYLQTGDKDVYAVGDVAASEDVIDKSKKIHAIWPVAVEQAKAAAKNMLGIKTYYMPEFSRNALPVFDITIFTGGLSNKDEFDVYKVENSSEYRKIVLDNGELKGFVLIGDVRNFGAYTHIAKRKINVSKNINNLLYGSLNINRL